MPYSVWSRVRGCSARKVGDVSKCCISGLQAAMSSDQSASPMARKDVTALLTLRLSAASSASCWVSVVARSGRAWCSQAW